MTYYSANPKKFNPCPKPEPTPKKEPKPLKRTPLKKGKPQGYLELYQKIWSERPHISEVSGHHIEEFNVSCFMHILNKRRYPRLKKDRRNIFLVLEEEHRHYDNIGRKDLELLPNWRKVFARRTELMNEEYSHL
jgi:hypothetical protein